jgi:hypothetical protein
LPCTPGIMCYQPVHILEKEKSEIESNSVSWNCSKSNSVWQKQIEKKSSH